MQRIGNIVFLLLAIPCAAAAGEIDSDHDGLADFLEIHKYRTDPAKADSDGDGIPDGDWHERREFAYSVRSVVKVLRPVDVITLNDDYQDARVLRERLDLRSPHGVVEREAVEEKHRRALAPVDVSEVAVGERDRVHDDRIAVGELNRKRRANSEDTTSSPQRVWQPALFRRPSVGDA